MRKRGKRREYRHSQIDESIDKFYKIIDVNRSDDSRKSPCAQARMALSNTLSMAGMSNEDIARLINRHRTSVVHHLKHHTGELRDWWGYKGKFETCQLIVGTAAEGASISNNLDIVLESLRDELKKDISKMEVRLLELENFIR
tara:strand:+ start:66 stop:494 length:429 start_codon:yes stop_codon:yes gene_type:complete